VLLDHGTRDTDLAKYVGDDAIAMQSASRTCSTPASLASCDMASSSTRHGSASAGPRSVMCAVWPERCAPICRSALASPLVIGHSERHEGRGRDDASTVSRRWRCSADDGVVGSGTRGIAGVGVHASG
jgi:hypothetical protein